MTPSPSSDPAPGAPTNRLDRESSPYLRQHRRNPVDWYPWGDEAFEQARRRDVPIFLSVGYSSCHWCHVMAHESFEDDEVAAALNEHFVNVKVDREERPDVDAVYMAAVTGMTGHGGWPMSVFLTPDGEPFYAGTYWPRAPRHGMPAFPQVLAAVADAWEQRRGEVLESASSIAASLAGAAETEAADRVDPSVADEAAPAVVEGAWDRRHGGFGSAPKFPQAMTIEWLLERHVRTGEAGPLQAAVHSLRAMAGGGIHDQLAGGFARYSTDVRWLVPHFEKMLYDNALLLAAYASGAAVTGDEDLHRVAESTASYLLTELRTADGGFVAATDADSEGVEGRYFVWSAEEFAEVVTEVGEEPGLFAEFCGVDPAGNWEGVNVLHRPVDRVSFARTHDLAPEDFDERWERVRAALLARRAERVPPEVDTKVLTSWNALAVRALVRAGVLLEQPGWVTAAATTAHLLHDRLTVDGRLHHVLTDGRVSVPAFLEDVACLALADLELFCATGEDVWFERALALAEDAEARFHDDGQGGWFQTAEDAEALYTRPKDSWDNATPAGTSVMVEVCRVLAGLTGEARWHERAMEGIRLFQQSARRMPTGYGWLLRQLEAVAAGPREVAVVGRPGPQRDVLARVATDRPRPGTVTVVTEPREQPAAPLLLGRGEVDGRPAAYVCRHLACERPTVDPAALDAQLNDVDGP